MNPLDPVVDAFGAAGYTLSSWHIHREFIPDVDIAPGIDVLTMTFIADRCQAIVCTVSRLERGVYRATYVGTTRVFDSPEAIPEWMSAVSGYTGILFNIGRLEELIAENTALKVENKILRKMLKYAPGG